MSNPKRSTERPSPSGFMMIRRRNKLLAERGATSMQIRELTKMRDGIRENAKLSGRGCDREQKALDVAESGLSRSGSRPALSERTASASISL